MYELARFALSDMISCGAAVRELHAGASTLDEVAARIVRFFYDSLATRKSGERNLVLARFYRTTRFADLPADLQQYANAAVDVPLQGDMQCLTLVATAGDRAEWNDPRLSKRHRTIPLPSVELVQRSPMVAQLIRQLGLDISDVVQPEPEVLVDLAQRTFNVFLVEEAVGSRHVPAQDDFVVPYGVRSVLGLGGVLPGAGFFAVVLFSKVPITRATAELFATISLNMKIALLPFVQSALVQDVVTER